MRWAYERQNGAPHSVRRRGPQMRLCQRRARLAGQTRTTTMRNILFAAVAVSALFVGTAAMADQFDGQNQTATQTGVNAYLDQQATGAQLSDPTAPDSIRSHGHP